MFALFYETKILFIPEINIKESFQQYDNIEITHLPEYIKQALDKSFAVKNVTPEM